MARRFLILHYHLFPGGVSSLILNSLSLLARKGLLDRRVRLIIGTRDRSEWFFERAKDALPPGVTLQVDVVPEIGYWQEGADKVEAAAATLKDKILSEKADVLWAHNPTLGKNPAYGFALKQIAAERPEQAIWMHVHDSAEQGRWPNLELMRRYPQATPYFLSPGTRWFLINRSDHRAYLECGMPEAFCRYVPDILPPLPEPAEADRNTIGRILAAFARKNGFTFHPEQPWFLFAGRTIRRKNLLEALMLSQCAKVPANLLVTLPSDSPDDASFEEALLGALKKTGGGIAGFGPECVNRTFRLAELADAAELIVSSSVMEGFGFPYLEFPRLGHPLFARRIPVMDDFAPMHEALPHYYYPRFLVETDSETRAATLAKYCQRVEKIGVRVGARQERKEELLSFFERHFSEKAQDFSFLPLSVQRRIVEGLTPAGKERVREINAALFEELDCAGKGEMRDPLEIASAVNAVFGEEVFANNIADVLKMPLLGPTALPAFDPETFRQMLQDHFFNPESLRLLLDYRTP
ncbi:MAG: hypothetical protein V1913_00685 [Fibrobacterota bacterium]